MLLSEHIKYRRQHRPKTTGRSKGGNSIAFGEYGLQATITSWITFRQVESAHIAMTRCMKRGGKAWTKIFSHTPYTRKLLEARVGTGKGIVEGWIAVVKPGRILFEIAGVSEDIAREALRLVSHKLSVEAKFVKHEKLSGETNES